MTITTPVPTTAVPTLRAAEPAPESRLLTEPRGRDEGQSLLHYLAVSISASGVVTAVEVAEKHSSALLNRAALKAADGLVGMKLPLSKAMTVKVPVVFSLSGS